MNRPLLILLVFLWSCSANNEKTPSVVNSTPAPQKQSEDKTSIQNGDLIFHTSLSNQSRAIQLATKSKYSHMGIIYKEGDKHFVYEAVQPVQLTPLEQWIKRGKGGHYVVKRLKNSAAILDEESIAKMKSVGEQYRGKDYDLKFEWSDEKIYCSELVWKIYKNVFDIEIGQLEKIKDFDLSNKAVQAKLKERYGDNIPLEEIVITPDKMFKSDKLETIIER